MNAPPQQPGGDLQIPTSPANRGLRKGFVYMDVTCPSIRRQKGPASNLGRAGLSNEPGSSGCLFAAGCGCCGCGCNPCQNGGCCNFNPYANCGWCQGYNPNGCQWNWQQQQQLQQQQLLQQQQWNWQQQQQCMSDEPRYSGRTRAEWVSRLQ